MGISRDSMHKRRNTGGKKKAWRKKRKKEKLLQQKKRRRAATCKEKLRNARRDANWINTLKNNLVVAGCWPAYPPVLINVAELTGKA